MFAVVFGAIGTELRRPGVAERYGWHEGDTVIVVPATVRQLPPYAFAGMEGLKRVEFASPSECLKIGEYAFAECVSLDSISLPETVMAIEEGAFRECRSLRHLRIPQGVWYLPKEMMHRCVSLETIELPYGLREIRPFALAGCERLKELHLPQGLNKIGNNAFSRCIAIKELELPPAVIELESYAFSDCESLQRLRLSESYNMIGELIVSGCGNLRILEVPPMKPPMIECDSYLFDPDDIEAYNNCTLYVPEGAEKYYRRYHGWRLFPHITALQ